MKNYIKSIGLTSILIILCINAKAQSKHQVGVNVMSGIDFLTDNKLDHPEITLQYKRLGKWNLRAGVNLTSFSTLEYEFDRGAIHSEPTSAQYVIGEIDYESSTERSIHRSDVYLGVEKNWKVAQWNFQLGTDFIAGLGSYDYSRNRTVTERYYHGSPNEDSERTDYWTSETQLSQLGFDLIAGVDRKLTEKVSLGLVYRMQVIWEADLRYSSQVYFKGVHYEDNRDGSYTYYRVSNSDFSRELLKQHLDVFISYNF